MKIKTVMLTVIVLLGLPPFARAQSATAFDYTGVTASENNIDLYSQWVSGEANTQLWAPANEIGLAQQFTISTPTNISSLETSVILNLSELNPGQGPEGTSINWDLDSGTSSSYEVHGQTIDKPVPLLSSVVLQSNPEIIAAYGGSSSQTLTEQLPFDVDLQPGTYWISEQGGGEIPATPSQEYIDPLSGTTPVPEPPTFWLFLMATAGFALLKRKILRFRLPVIHFILE